MGMPLKTMRLIAVVAKLNGVIVHVVMISRVLCGLAQLNARTGTLLRATAFGIIAILAPALAVPLSGLADRTDRFTLVVFAIISIALFRIRSCEAAAPSHVFVCLEWEPIAGLITSIGLLCMDLVVR